MASIRERVGKGGKRSWYVLWRDPDTGKQTSMTFRTAPDASRFRRLLDANGQRLTLVERTLQAVARQEPTMDELLERRLSTLTRANERTKHDYRNNYANRMQAHFGGRHVSTVDELVISDWVNAMKRSHSHKTLRNDFGLLHGMFETAVAAGWRADNPTKRVQMPDPWEVATPARALEHAEYDLILACARTPADKLFLDASVETGLRFNEQTALTPEDISRTGGAPTLRITKAWKRNGASGWVVGRPKSPASVRNVPITEALCARLLDLKRGPGELLFQSRADTPIRSSRFHQTVWQPLLDRAAEQGLAWRPRVHDLRHTHATWMLQAGEPIYLVSRRLGHSSVAVTEKVYAHVTAGSAAETINSLERALGRG